MPDPFEPLRQALQLLLGPDFFDDLSFRELARKALVVAAPYLMWLLNYGIAVVIAKGLSRD